MDTTKIKTKYTLRITVNTPGRRNIPIDSKVFQFLLAHRDSFFSNHQHGRAYPWCALLGTDEYECVRMLVKVYPKEGGCWNMPDISPDVFADSAIKLATRGYKISGLVRIGKFNLSESHSRGPSLQEFGRNAPGFYVMSLGLEGMCIETWSRGRTMKHGWVTVKGGDYNGCEESKAARGQGDRDADVREEYQGDVRKVDGTDRVCGTEQGNDSAGVSAQTGHGVQLSSPGESSDSTRRLRTAGRSGHNDDLESQRRLMRNAARRAAARQAREVRDAARAQLRAELLAAREREMRRNLELDRAEAARNVAEARRLVEESQVNKSIDEVDPELWKKFSDVLYQE